MRFAATSLLLLALTTVVFPRDTVRAAENPPSADELVQRVVAVNEAARARRQGFEYDLTTTTERLDAEGKVLKTRTNRGVARPGRQVEFTMEVTPDPNATAEERARTQREMQESERMQATMNLKRLAPHFDYAVEGSGKMEGRDCWVLSYRPRPGAPAAGREEAVLNHLQGRAWIDKQTFDIVRNQGSLPAPVNLAFIASMNRLSFVYRSQVLPNGDLAPASFRIEINVTAPLYYFEQRQTSTMTNYRSR